VSGERRSLRVLPGGREDASRAGAIGGAGSRPRGSASAAPTSSGSRPRGLVSGALAAAGSFLIEPAVPQADSPPEAPSGLRPVVAVFGLARGCGVTVVSRALAVELAGRDAAGTAAVHCDSRPAGIPLATSAAARLAKALQDVPGADTRAVGRLCLVAGAERAALADTARHFAPLVLDAGSASLGGAPAALADRVVVVAAPATEPALASVAVECLGRLGCEPVVVLNRTPARNAVEAASTWADRSPARESDEPPSAWAGRAALNLPESRMGAQLALGGRETRGELGRAVAELADLCEVAR
jgi:hypothetical protein